MTDDRTLAPDSMATSPLWPVVVIAVALTLLGLEGLGPYRVWWQLRTWKTARATLLQTYERRVEHRATSDGAPSPSEYLSRIPQQRVFQQVVTKGWPVKRKEKQWLVRISYSFAGPKGVVTRVGDQAPLTFGSSLEASAFVQERIDKNAIKVWYDPGDPGQATAFLDTQSFRWIRFGLTLLGLGLVWLLILAWRRAVRNRLLAEAAHAAKAP
jgi:hypothetical protein